MVHMPSRAFVELLPCPHLQYHYFFAKKDIILPWPLGAGFFAFAVPPELVEAAAGVAFFGGGASSSSEKDSQAVSRTVTGKREGPEVS